MLNRIVNNPYRILGVLSNSPLRERIANQNKLNAFAKVGKDLSFPNDFIEVISQKPLRTIDSISKAIVDLNLDKDQIKYAFFWFISGSPMDDIALKHLRAGNRDKAEEIFQKKETYSSLINSAVLALIDGNTASGFNNISKVIHNSTYRAELLQALDLANLQLSESDLAELIIAELHKEVPASELLSACNNATDRAIVSKSALDEPISAINSAISVAKNADTKNPEASLAAGTKLMNSTKAPLKAVKDIAGATSPQYQMVADNVAKQVLQCGINYYNNAPDSDVESPRKAMVLQSYALSIAVGQLTKDRCQENYNILKEVLDNLPPDEIKGYVGEIDTLLNELRTNFDIGKILVIQCKIMLYCGIIRDIIGDSSNYYRILENRIVHASLNPIIEYLNIELTRKVSIWEKIVRESKLDFAYNYIKNLEEFRMNSEISSWYKSNLDKITEIISEICESALKRRRPNHILSESSYYNKCTTIEDYNTYLAVFPSGKFYKEAKNQIDRIKQKEKEKEEAEKRRLADLKNKIALLSTLDKCLEFKSTNYPLTSDLRNQLDDKAFSLCFSAEDLSKYVNTFSRHSSKAYSLLTQYREERERATSIGCWIAVYAIVGLILYLIIG